MKAAYQILTANQIDAGLAAGRGVHLSQQSSRHLQDWNATHKNGRKKAADIGNDTAAEADDEARTVGAVIEKLVGKRFDRSKTFVRFAARKKQNLNRSGGKLRRYSRAVQTPNVFGGNDETLAGMLRDKSGDAPGDTAFDNVFIRVVRGFHLEGWHVFPLYHVVISGPYQRISTDFVVVGAGVAGLRAAIELSSAGRILVIAKDSLRESSSEYAQGGIAAALSDDDEVELHEQDTLVAGDGLCDVEAVHTLVEEAPAAIEQLIEWGTAFDREGTKLLFAREGAHSRNRVLHAHGDSTGSEIVRTLRQHARSIEGVSFQSFAAVTDLLTHEGEVAGVSVLDEMTHSTVLIEARAVLLATGGLGRVFENTTNPDVATGDGVACAFRAGATISDIEFVQFHPTALFVESAPRFLLSEALRGEAPISGTRAANALWSVIIR